MSPDSYKTIRRATQQMLDGWEGRDVDFKRTASSVDAEDFVALANASGGTILIGVDEVDDGNGQHGEVVGCEVSDQTRLTLISKAQSCRPPIDIQVTPENMRWADRRILTVEVPEGTQKPYCTSAGTYKIRVQGRNAPIEPEQLLGIFIEREERTFLDRFREAASAVVAELQAMEERVSEDLERIQQAADTAARAADIAGQAAENAAAHAEEAAVAASDAAVAAEEPW